MPMNLLQKDNLTSTFRLSVCLSVCRLSATDKTTEVFLHFTGHLISQTAQYFV